MGTCSTTTILEIPGRVPVFTAGLPIVVCDQQGNVIGKFRSPRKFGKALVSAELILTAGDKIHVGQIPGVVS
jgi:hypothetical protein